MLNKIIEILYLPKKLIKREGKIIDKIQAPKVAPQTGAPIPQA